MKNELIPSHDGKIYRIDSFIENRDMVGLGRSFSLLIKEHHTLAPVPELGSYQIAESHPLSLKFRFNIPDSRIRNWDIGLYPSIEEGIRTMIRQSLKNKLNDPLANLLENDPHEQVINL